MYKRLFILVTQTLKYQQTRPAESRTKSDKSTCFLLIRKYSFNVASHAIKPTTLLKRLCCVTTKNKVMYTYRNTTIDFIFIYIEHYKSENIFTTKQAEKQS